jgi:hypothetical protein
MFNQFQISRITYISIGFEVLKIGVLFEEKKCTILVTKILAYLQDFKWLSFFFHGLENYNPKFQLWGGSS